MVRKADNPTSRNWGGARPGAGRKPDPERTGDVHRARPPLAASGSAVVTLRTIEGAPKLTSPGPRRVLDRVLAELEPGKRASFAVKGYAVHEDHVHLLVEADDLRSFSSGMRAFAISVALRLKMMQDRESGKIWAGRYHRKDLRSPAEVRHVKTRVLAPTGDHECPDRPLLAAPAKRPTRKK